MQNCNYSYAVGVVCEVKYFERVVLCKLSWPEAEKQQFKSNKFIAEAQASFSVLYKTTRCEDEELLTSHIQACSLNFTPFRNEITF